MNTYHFTIVIRDAHPNVENLEDKLNQFSENMTGKFDSVKEETRSFVDNGWKSAETKTAK